MSEPLHPHQALHEAADGRLDAAARAALDVHLVDCAACRAELDAIRWTKGQVAAAREDTGVPAGFESWLQGALASEPEEESAGDTSPPAGAEGRSMVSRRRWAAIAGLAALILLAIWALPRRGSTDLPALVAADYRAVRAGTLPLGIRSSDVAEIERWFRGEGLRFETRVFDLGMMRYAATGGRVHAIGSQPSALFVYRGPDGEALVCQMYEGRTADLPAPWRRASRNGIDFLVFQRDGLTLVFWQEGALVCVLTGQGDPQAVIDLAFAKAMKV